MSETKTAMVPASDTRAVGARAPVEMDSGGARLTSTMDAWTVAEMMATGMGILKPAMADHEKRQAVARFATRILTGVRAGLNPEQAVRGLYDVNGRVAWYVETLRGLLLSRGIVPLDDDEAFQLGIENEPTPGTLRKDWPDNVAGFATIRRTGWKKPKTVRFTVADAKMAGLWGKPGPWQEYPKRQLQERAFGFWCRDYAADVTMNLPIGAEAQDIEELRASAPALPPPPQPASGPGLLAAIDAEPERVDVVAEPEPEHFDIEDAQDQLGSELFDRVGPGEDRQDARDKLFHEITAGLQMTTPDAFAEAHRRLRRHGLFGDAASNTAQGGSDEPSLFDAPPERRPNAPGKRGK